MKCPDCDFENPADTRFCGSCGASLMTQADISSDHTKTAQTPMKERIRGTIIAGRYEIIEELGRGGMGNVYRVVDKKLNEEMALKMLHPAIASDEKTIERFKNELKFARKIIHKHVCRMYDLSEEERAPFITMEYVPGEDLKSMIRMMGQLSLGRAISIAKQVCQGLEEAHDLGVVHRDLKPRNIMIDKKGNVRIMDFGIARSLRAEGITGDGIMVGTPEYMSPEQVKGEKADQRSDIYSLGIILFEMLTGKVPFEGDTSLSIALKQKKAPPPNPQEYNALIPEDVSQAILKCMEKEKEKRYQSAEEVFAELSRIEEEISTHVPGKRLKFSLIMGIFAVAVIIVIGYILLTRIPPNGQKKLKDSIAVLLFEDRSEKEDPNFCEEMTIKIIGKLAQVDGLDVKPYRTSGQLKDRSNREIGRQFDVKKILESYIEKDKNRIQVYSNIIDANKDSVIKHFEFSDVAENVFALQDNLVKEIAKTLELSLVTERLEDYKKREPKDTAAYPYYISGREFHEEYIISKEESDFVQAKKMYEEAIDVDPAYAEAYWRLGILHEVRYNIDPEDRDPEDLRSMHLNLQKAYDINPNLAESHIGLGWAYFYKADYDKAFDFFKSALEKEPHNSEINYHIGAFFLSIGLYRQAIKFCTEALKFNPLDFYAHYIRSNCSTYLGEYNKAEHYFDEALNLYPKELDLLSCYAFFLILNKNFEEAENVLERAEKIDEKEHWRHRHARALILAIKGEKEKALQLIESNSYRYFATSIYSLLGMRDEAIRNIQKGIEIGVNEIFVYLYSYPFLESNPYYDNLRSNPRFQEIVKEEKEKYKDKLKKYGKL